VASKHDWDALGPRIRELEAQGQNPTQIARTLGMSRQTIVDFLRRHGREITSTPVLHPDVPEYPDTPEAHPEAVELEHQGTPGDSSMPAIHPSTLRQEYPSAVHLSTPEAHPEVSGEDSGVPIEHSGVPARQDPLISTPMAHPGTPAPEDWALWHSIKGRWGEVEKMLADWRTRQALLSTPEGTPGHTVKKTYAMDSRYVALIERYAQEQGVELKDVVNLAFREFFERRQYLPGAWS
jgi:hypothetical protein